MLLPSSLVPTLIIVLSHPADAATNSGMTHKTVPPEKSASFGVIYTVLPAGAEYAL